MKNRDLREAAPVERGLHWRPRPAFSAGIQISVQPGMDGAGWAERVDIRPSVHLVPMKTFVRHPWIWLCGVLLAFPACATLPQPEVPGTLKVTVNVPPSWNLLVDDRVAEAFTDRVREVFHRAGFDRPVEEVRYVEDPAKVPLLLTINLHTWRINRLGNIDCTFSASLKTPRGTRDLGLYANTTTRWFGGIGRWGWARSFEEAAEGAIHNLCDAVAKSELLPGLRKAGLYSGLRKADGAASKQS